MKYVPYLFLNVSAQHIEIASVKYITFSHQSVSYLATVIIIFIMLKFRPVRCE